MILVFGQICTEFSTHLDEPLEFNRNTTSKNGYAFAGGSATNQAIAAARSGAKVSIAGTIGNDLFAKNILDTFRREGIQSSGIAQNDKPTGVIQTLVNPDGQSATIYTTGANREASESQISDNALNARTLLLLQNDLLPRQNLKILTRANEKNAKSVLCLSNLNNIDEAFFEYADIVLINDDLLPDMKSFLDQLKNPYIVTRSYGTQGAYVLHGKEKRFEQPPISDEPITNVKCFNAFCGTFSACTQAGIALEKSISYGVKAATLMGLNKTSQQYPYLSDIEKFAA